MPVGAATSSDDKTGHDSSIRRDRRQIIEQIREITGCDENSINQTIEACRDKNGQFSLEQVVNILVDDQLKVNFENSSSKNCRTKSTDRRTNSGNELEPHDENTENAQSIDDDLERAIELSRENGEQIIDESDVAQRNSLDEPAGLKNVGNTCWFNSIIQSLYTLPKFRRLILDFRFSTVERPLNELERQTIHFIEELRLLFVLMLKSPRRSINPERSIKKFKKTRKLWSIDFSHEDCSEFATHLIDLVENGYDIASKNSPSSTTNPIQSFLSGEILIERHDGKSIREALRQIQIQLIGTKNLYDGLEALWLGSADENFSSNEPIVEQRWLTRLPPVLFICLNRYRFSQKTKQTAKISSSFEFYPQIFLDRFIFENKETILTKRNIARSLYAELHKLENILNSYLKYSCNNETFSLANAIRAVYEYTTGCRLNPTLPRRNDSASSETTISHRVRSSSSVSVRPSNVTDDEFQFIQNTLPTWLTEIEGKCAQLKDEIKRVENELNKLYDDDSLRRVRYTLHSVCVHEGTAAVGHFWTYVYHSDQGKWFKYNDNEVTESRWDEVFEAAIGGEPKSSDPDEETRPSAYLLVYTKNEEKNSSIEKQFELTSEFQQFLDADLQYFREQIETFRLEKIFENLKKISEELEKPPNVDRVLSLPFFSGSNPACETDLIKISVDSMIENLRKIENEILSVGVGRLLNEFIEKEIRKISSKAIIFNKNSTQQDFRLKNIVSYFVANRVEPIFLRRVLLDIIRLLPVANDDVRLKIFKFQAKIFAYENNLNGENLQKYEKLLNDYKDFRSIVAAYLSGCQLLLQNKFDEGITFFCVAAEYNLRITKPTFCSMRGMDAEILYQTRRLCFQLWNEIVVNRFKNDENYRLDSMTKQFLPCLMQLKLSTIEDQNYIGEIQKSWFLLLDKIENSERCRALEDFLQRLLEQPIGQHFHSVSINKNSLFERLEETLSELSRRFPTFFIRTTNSIPIVVQRTSFPGKIKENLDSNKNSPPS